MATAVEGGHVTDIEAQNKVIREIVEARNSRKYGQTSVGQQQPIDDEPLEKVEEETSITTATPLPEPEDGVELFPAEKLLSESLAAVRDRRVSYGHPKDHFARTVGMINAAFADKLRVPLEPSDWPLIMILDKIARHTGEGRKKPDTPVDLAGYAATLAEVEDVR